MNQNDTHNKLKRNVKKDIERLEKAQKEKTSLLAQTAYLGTLGFVFILPVILGAYLGIWLDNRFSTYFSISWTISLICVGVMIGAVNVYLLIKDK